MTDQQVDRRVQRTRQLLADALTTLILDKGYDKITVQDIVDQANVGRSTFYAHYLDKDDLMESNARELMEEFRQHISPSSDRDSSDVMIPTLVLFQHTQQQHHVYKAILGGRGIEILVKAIEKDLTAYARGHFEQTERAGTQLRVPVEVLSTYFAGSLLTLLTWWLDNDMPYPPEQMDEMFQELNLRGMGPLITYGSGATPG